MVMDCAHSTTMNAFMIKLKVQQWHSQKVIRSLMV
jgi:hypothetical protein